MLNVIFTLKTTPTMDIDTVDFLSKNAIWVSQLPECRVIESNTRICSQACVNNMETLEQLKMLISDALPEVVGVWYSKTGLQYGYESVNTGTVEAPIYEIQRIKEYVDGVLIGDLPIKYPFDIAKYTDSLSDIVTYDQDHNVISSVRPTQAQARDIQVNTFGGMPPKRNLENMGLLP